ncbi:MAG: hypothetical protein J5790_06405 [Bacteroidaceae bacterium]|nr:hypothetical protein [Bacteroidaceae bacterium]
MKAITFLALMLVALVGMTSCSSDDKESFREWTYTGNNTLTIDKEYDPVEITCKVTQRENGTLEVEMPEYQLNGTTIGNLTIGAVTIKNIMYNTETGSYYRMFGKDGLTMHFKAEGGHGAMDNDYAFTEDSYIDVKQSTNGVIILLNYSFGKMPMRIISRFEVAVAKDEE